jgi:hypothetical protein
VQVLIILPFREFSERHQSLSSFAFILQEQYASTRFHFSFVHPLVTVFTFMLLTKEILSIAQFLFPMLWQLHA